MQRVVDYCRELQHCQPSLQHHVASHHRELQRCRPSLQRRVVGHRRNNVTSCSTADHRELQCHQPSPQRCVARSYNVALLPAIPVVAVDLCPSDVCQTFVRHPSDICRTFVMRLPSGHHAPCYIIVLRPTIMRPIVLSSCLCIQHLFDFHLTFV